MRRVSRGLDVTPTYTEIFDDRFFEDYSRVHTMLMYMECRMKDVLSFCKARDKAVLDYSSAHGFGESSNVSLTEGDKEELQIALLKYSTEWQDHYAEQTF